MCIKRLKLLVKYDIYAFKCMTQNLKRTTKIPELDLMKLINKDEFNIVPGQ